MVAQLNKRFAPEKKVKNKKNHLICHAAKYICDRKKKPSNPRRLDSSNQKIKKNGRLNVATW